MVKMDANKAFKVYLPFIQYFSTYTFNTSLQPAILTILTSRYIIIAPYTFKGGDDK